MTSPRSLRASPAPLAIAAGLAQAHTAGLAVGRMRAAPRPMPLPAVAQAAPRAEPVPGTVPVVPTTLLPALNYFGQSDGWELDRDRFARVECPDRVVCLFEEDGAIGERQGPFTGLAVVDGTLRCGERVIATLRGSYWQSEKTRRAWPRVRMVEARG